MKTSIQGYPRIGAARELKFRTERYFAGEEDDSGLVELGKELRSRHWREQAARGIDLIPSNDFSHYDGMLDAAILLGAVPARFRRLGLGALGTQFAMARGYQGARGDAKALPMRKWFTTNYHYIAPELEDETPLSASGDKPVAEFLEARALGLETKPTLIGPFTFLALARGSDGLPVIGSRHERRRANEAAVAYGDILARLASCEADWVSFEEPALALDLTARETELFAGIYRAILARKGQSRAILQTSFGDLRDAWREAVSLPFDAIGLDFLEGEGNLDLIARHGFPEGKTLIAGVVNGKNVWRNDYGKTLRTIEQIMNLLPYTELAVGSSCSLLHVPHTLEGETALPDGLAPRLAFAREKLAELSDIRDLLVEATANGANCPRVAPLAVSVSGNASFRENRRAVALNAGARDAALQSRVKALSARDWTRVPEVGTRAEIQRELLALPILPATTIGSFPQTAGVKSLRARFRKNEIGESEYRAGLRECIARSVAFQERIGLDVLVHGEFERNDMVEYFGENLEGFAFTARGWVQSYGTRCVKPPVIFADVRRRGPITAEWSAYAQSLTSKPVKGMLTGPVTVLNWSFPPEDITPRECAFQIALAIREEVLDLERAGIPIIQIDEAAFREKLPLRKADRNEKYLDWAIPAFSLAHAAVRAGTQIHTHMCYSDFSDVIDAIDAMDADVISFEASRSGLSILEPPGDGRLRAAVGPGVYDIHSPRVPSPEELLDAITRSLAVIGHDRLWVNPDCGLKTRGDEETARSLENMMKAVVAARNAVEGGKPS